MTIRRVLALVLLSLSLAACTSTNGRKFEASKVDQLQPKVSTISDATALLGPASAESSFPDGGKLLQWQYTQGSLGGGSGAHVAVLFDAKGTMVRVTHKWSMGQQR